MATKSNIDLDSLSVQDLTALIQSAEAKRSEKLEQAKADLIAEMEQKAAAMGLSLDGLYAAPEKAQARTRKPRKDIGTTAGAKFRGPNGEEWSGRGRPPGWLTGLESQGRSRDEFRI